jgi:hypothetical protein
MSLPAYRTAAQDRSGRVAEPRRGQRQPLPVASSSNQACGDSGVRRARVRHQRTPQGVDLPVDNVLLRQAKPILFTYELHGESHVE